VTRPELPELSAQGISVRVQFSSKRSIRFYIILKRCNRDVDAGSIEDVPGE
jgi:hypothetical protein